MNQKLKTIQSTLKTKLQDRNIIGLFVYGSQNYGLDNKDSDVDVKCVVENTKADFWNHSGISKVYEHQFGEADVKDCQTYYEMLQKGNPAYFEILFDSADKMIVNPTYKKQWDSIVSKRYDYIRNNIGKILMATRGMMSEKEHNLSHPYPKQVKELEEYGYIRKQFSHFMRLVDFTQKLIYICEGKNENPFALTTKEMETLRNYKYNKMDLRVVTTLMDANKKVWQEQVSAWLLKNYKVEWKPETQKLSEALNKAGLLKNDNTFLPEFSEMFDKQAVFMVKDKQQLNKDR